MSDIAMTNKIMQIHLSSWRYFAFLTLPPLILAFNSLFSWEKVVVLILFFITHYYCWRLWLDERLFQLLNNENDLLMFDEGMTYLLPVKSGKVRPLVERLHGARGLFYRTIFALLTLWIVSLSSIIFLSLKLILLVN